MAEISTIARPYAVAAYHLAKENQALDSWSDMLGLMSAVASHDDMFAYINDPKVIDSALEENFLKVCGDKLTAHGQNLVRILVEYKRMAMIPAIFSAFETLKAQDQGVLKAQIISATELSSAESSNLVEKIEAKFSKKIEANFSLDEEIIGGIKIIVGDTVIDASLKSQLQSLAYTLSA
jgi:F-type H+-transporting ATPase subunit delta